MAVKQLMREIVALSVSDDWETAKDEWALSETYDNPGETCLCGQNPIREVCVVFNKLNGAFTEVGNVCVNNFLGLASDTIFTSLKRVKADPKKSVNNAGLDLARANSTINDWEYKFLRDIGSKQTRSLSQRQLTLKVKLNTSILIRHFRAA